MYIALNYYPIDTSIETLAAISPLSPSPSPYKCGGEAKTTDEVINQQTLLKL